MPGSAVAAPKVFISYSHDSPQHQDRVLALSDRLRTDGIDAIIDQYEPSPRDGWPRWTERQIQDADFVLLVCTETYLRRVQNRETSTVGRGVVWEANLIYNHIAAGSTIGKFVPVLLDEGGESLIPTPVRGVTHYTIADESGYEALYRHLTNQPAAVRTALGTIHSLPPRKPRSYPASHHETRQRQTLSADDERNRHKMLARVYHDWIQGVLERSLYKVARLDFVVSSAPAAVEKRFPIGLEPRDTATARLTAPAAIGDVFDEHVGALLVLGAPGAGKTTLLLELAHTLQRRAERDRSVSVPVIFNLSSWSLRKPTLAAWLVDELNEHYDMPRGMAQQWLDRDEILPLLDGLDEVAAADREACVDAVNEFRRENGLLPIAVCSRATEYEALSSRLRLSAAVVIQPLTREQVVEYLERAGAPLSAVRDAASRDPSIVELLDTPLALDIVRLALEGGQDNALRAGQRFEVRREQLVASYVEAVFRRRSLDRSLYSKDDSRQWLVRLAGMMTRQSQTTFHLESLRPEWLVSERQRRLATAAIWIAIAFLGAAFVGVTDVAFLAVFGVPDIVWSKGFSERYAAALQTVYNPLNPIVDSLFGAGVAIVAAFTAGRVMSAVWSWKVLRDTTLRGLAWGSIAGARVGVTLGAVVGLTLGLFLPLEGASALRVVLAPIMTMIAGTVDAIQLTVFGSLAGLLAGAALAITLGADGVIARPEWSPRAIWRSTRRGFGLGVRVGAAAGVLGVMVVAFVDPAALRGTDDGGTAATVIVAVVFAIIAGLGGGLFGALLGSLGGSIIGLVFVAPTLPSLRPLLTRLKAIAGATRDIRPVDRVSWSWRHPRRGLAGALQFGVLGGILGAILLGSMGGVSGGLKPFLDETIAAPFGSVSIESVGQLERVLMASELMLVNALANGLMGAVLMALSLGPLGFIEGMLVRTDLGTRSAPNEGTTRSARSALLTSLCVGLALAAIQVPLALLTMAVGRGVGSAANLGGQQMALLSAVSGAQIGMLCAAVRNGGLFCVQHMAVRNALWWTGSAPWRYGRFLDHSAGQLALLRKVGGGYIFSHRFVLEYFASFDDEGRAVGGVTAPSGTATV